MQGFIELLFVPIQPFVWQPERAFMAALVFLAFFVIAVVMHKGAIRIKELWPLLAAFAFWLLFALNEYIAHANKTNIRIDLLAFGPFIMALSVFAVYVFVKSFLMRK